jgi:hypothetical protein
MNVTEVGLTVATTVTDTTDTSRVVPPGKLHRPVTVPG